MGRQAGTDQDRPDRDHPGHRLDQVVGDVGGVEARHDEQIGGALQGGGGHDPPPHFLGQGGVGVHLAVHLEFGIQAAEEGQSLAHLEGGGSVAAAETAVGNQRHLGGDAEAADDGGGGEGGLGDVLDAGIVAHVGIGQEHHPLVEHQRVQRGRLAHPLPHSEDAGDVLEMALEHADGAGDQGVGLAAGDHDGTDHGPAGADDLARHLRGHPAPPHAFEIEGDVVVVAGVAVRVAELEIDPRPQGQAVAFDPHPHDVGTADQDRSGEPLLDHHLHRPQDALLLAVGVDHPLRSTPRPLEQRLHQEAGLENPLAQPVAVLLEIGDRPDGDAGIHRRPRHRRRDLGDQARIEGLGNEIVGTEGEAFEPVGGGHRVGSGLAGESGECLDAGPLHGVVDGGGAAVESAAEDERKAEDVVDLVRIVGASGGDDGVGTDGAGLLGHDFRHRIGEGHDDRPLGHRRHHLRLQDPGRRKTEEDVGAADRLGESAHFGLAGEARLPGIHQLLASLVDHPLDVGGDDVLAGQAEGDQEIETGEGGGAGAARDQPNFLEAAARQMQGVQNGRRDDDRGAVLVVVEDRDPHPLAQTTLHLETFGRLDVLEVDGTEGRFESRHDLHETVDVTRVQLQIEGVDAGEFLEQDGLALHHRLGRQGADGAEAQHRRAVGDDGHEIGADGEFRDLCRIFGDGLAGGGHPRRIGEREIALGGERLGRHHLELAGPGTAMEVQGVVAKAVGHGDLPARRGPGHSTPRCWRQQALSRPVVRNRWVVEDESRESGSWCGREDSNFHGVAPTSPSSWRVYQFRHDRTSHHGRPCR